MDNNTLIDIDSLLKIWSGCNLKHYFDKLKGADPEELKAFIIEVRTHKKNQNRLQRAFSDSPKSYSIHDALIQASKWELIKRKHIRLSMLNCFYPFRKSWLRFWCGTELIRHHIFGFYKKKQHDSTFKHLGLFKFLIKYVVKPSLRYLGKNANWIVPMIVGSAVALLIAFLITGNR